MFDTIFSTRQELIQKVIRGEKGLPWFWSREAETGHTQQRKNESRTKIAKTDTQMSKLHFGSAKSELPKQPIQTTSVQNQPLIRVPP